MHMCENVFVCVCVCVFALERGCTYIKVFLCTCV